MHPIISLCLIRPSHWTTTSRRKRTAKGSSATARTMWNHTTKSTTHLKAVDMAARTCMGAILAKGMVVTSMAISTIEDSGEITPMVITMDTKVSTAITQRPRGIFHRSLISNAKRLDIMPTAAQITSPLSLPSPIHFRKAK
jgi:hypothetical protein